LNRKGKGKRNRNLSAGTGEKKGQGEIRTSEKKPSSASYSLAGAKRTRRPTRGARREEGTPRRDAQKTTPKRRRLARYPQKPSQCPGESKAVPKKNGGKKKGGMVLGKGGKKRKKESKDGFSDGQKQQSRSCRKVGSADSLAPAEKKGPRA